MTRKQLIIGALLCLIASMSWGAMFPVAHHALQKIDPFYFSFIRYIAVSAILCVLLLIKEGKSAFRLEGKGKQLTFYGTMAFVVYNMCIFLGQKLMGDAGIIAASIFESLMPMITILLMWVTTRAVPPGYMLVSVVVALTGAVLVITKGSLSFFLTAGSHALPLLLIFIAVVGWVIYSIGGGKFPGWSVLRYSTMTCLLGSAVSFVIVGTGSAFNIIAVPTWDVLVSVKYEMSFMILLPGLGALLSWNAGIKRLSPLNGILFINFVPITTFAIMALEGYAISIYEIIGTLLIIAALVGSNLFQRKLPSQPISANVRISSAASKDRRKGGKPAVGALRG